MIKTSVTLCTQSLSITLNLAHTHNNFQQSSHAPGYGYDIYNEITIRKHKSISINTEHKPSAMHFSFNW